MSQRLRTVPAKHRPALENWIACVGLDQVATHLNWLATHQLYHQPQGRLYGLSAPELLLLAQDLEAPE